MSTELIEAAARALGSIRGHQIGENGAMALPGTQAKQTLGRLERAVASIFVPGGTLALAGEFAGSADFEVVASLVLPRETQGMAA